jgi:ATP-dependent DNA helicase RecQ
MYGDAGWGRLVKEGKYTTGSFDRRLVDASVELVREWAPTPAPTWVTAIPSSGHPALVRDFAEALAKSLALPFRPSLLASAGAPQKTMENGAQRVRNVHAKIGVAPGAIDPGPVLLVDDIFDSGWTIAYAGHLLRDAGVEAVIPLTLALASNRADA